MQIASFSEIEQSFLQRVRTMVWCNVATLDAHSRPRSRILHPIWEGATGWIITRRRSHKSRHLAQHPYVSLAYVADIVKPVYADCLATWADDPATKRRVWELFRTIEPPVGYDPASIFGSVDDPDCGVLQLTPWRIELYDVPGGSDRFVWRAERTEPS
jgi:general stress protein 26